MSETATLHVTRNDYRLSIAVTGRVTADDIIGAIGQEYPTLDGRSILWDFRDCDVAALDPRKFGSIATAAFSTVDHKATRKTAYVVKGQEAYVKACKYLNEAIALRMPIEYAVFTSIEVAEEWLRKK